jgi:peptidoglycan/LPS O-acetylase OafA/YrhL
MLPGNQYSIRTDIAEKAYPPPWASSLPLDPVHWDPSLANALLHVSFLFELLPTFASNNVLPDWSLALEMQFYAVFPFLMLFRRRLGLPAKRRPQRGPVRRKQASGECVLAEPKLLGAIPQPTLLPLKLIFFLVGMLISEAYYSARASIIYGALAIFPSEHRLLGAVCVLHDTCHAFSRHQASGNPDKNCRAC